MKRIKISTNATKLSVLFDENKRTNNLVPIFLLHGFTGKANDWNFLDKQLSAKYFLIKIDILGHGKSDSPTEKTYYSEINLVKQLHSVINYFGFKKNILFGYSMGGRIALSYSLVYPEKISALILESASPGIENSFERQLRIEHDKNLAESIFDKGTNKFIRDWVNQPFFNSLKNIGSQKLLKIITERSLNNPVGLANILTEFGQGKMKSKWTELDKINFPIMLISGQLDKKYCEINKKASKLFKNAELIIIRDSGHNVHLEKEKEFVNFVGEFLIKHF